MDLQKKKPRVRNTPKNKAGKGIAPGQKMSGITSTKPVNVVVPSNVSTYKSELGIGSLSECAAKMAVAIANPWSPLAKGACLPTSPARPTYKVTAFQRGIAYVGTNGFGYIIVQPTIANDVPFSYSTTASYTGTSSDTFTPYSATPGTLKTGISVNNMNNIPYASSSIWNNTFPDNTTQYIQGRIVAVGLSVQYTGTTLNESGTLTCFSHPTHADLSYSNLSNVQAFVDSETKYAGRDKCWLSSGPVSDEETMFDRTTKAMAAASNNPASSIFQSNLLFPWMTTDGLQNSSSAVTGSAPMVAAFSGVAGQSYYFEVVAHLEYIGASAQVSATPNVADTVGLHKVIAATGKIPELREASPNKTYGQLMVEALKEVGREIMPIAGTALKTAVMAALV